MHIYLLKVKLFINITANPCVLLNYIRFDHQYDVVRLKEELAMCFQAEWSDHFNQNDYTGCWQSISLRSASGKESDIYASYGISSYQDTKLLTNLTYIKEIIGYWQCEKESIRLLALHPGSEIKPHRDLGCNYQDGNFRLHIPIQTNNQVIFKVDEENLSLKEGSCWYVDFNKTHSIKNDGTEVRIHLVIDALRNKWTDEEFSKNGYDLSEASENKHDDAVNLQIIAELERMDSDVARQLIKQLQTGR